MTLDSVLARYRPWEIAVVCAAATLLAALTAEQLLRLVGAVLSLRLTHVFAFIRSLAPVRKFLEKDKVIESICRSRSFLSAARLSRSCWPGCVPLPRSVTWRCPTARASSRAR